MTFGPLIGPARPIAERLAITGAPEATAIVFRSQTISYEELGARVHAYATRLRDAGVGADALVGVCMDRSPNAVAALLACWHVGAAYVPIDPELPADRIAYILHDAAAAAVIADPVGEARLGRYAGPVVLDPGAPVVTNATPAPRAYVTYTSGSTGKPKGVAVSHRALSNVLDAMSALLPPFTACAALTSFSFDISGLELFLPLTRGRHIVLIGREETRDGQALARALSDVDLVQATPSTFRLLADAGFTPRQPTTILCGGEAWHRDLKGVLTGWSQEVWNVYGPTETTIWSAARRVTAADDDVYLGGPLANTQLHVLDEARNPTDDGELYIGGAGLADGYWRRSELTAQRFVHVRGERLYATGDHVVRRANGDLWYRGRFDSQVKVRGHRVELGEIEACLLDHPDVKAAACTYDDEKLVAFVVLKSALSEQALRHHLRLTLPEYMMPHAIALREALPLQPSGKIDRRALNQTRDT